MKMLLELVLQDRAEGLLQLLLQNCLNPHQQAHTISPVPQTHRHSSSKSRLQVVILLFNYYAWASYYEPITFFHFTESPRQPVNVTVSIMHPVLSPMVPYSLTVQWDAPANIDKFDLEHYTIQALSSEEGYVLNVTGSELEYPFGVIMNTLLAEHELSNLTVSAVSKCSQQGPEASAAVTVPTPKVINNPRPMDIFDSAITFDSNGNEFIIMLNFDCLFLSNYSCTSFCIFL